MLPEDSDESLLARFCAGEASAYGDLLRRFQREIYAYLRRYLGQDALAEDVIGSGEAQVNATLRPAKFASDPSSEGELYGPAGETLNI
jgi:DNA-directed RNA polymerase specialized sigma24 family protein